MVFLIVLFVAGACCLLGVLCQACAGAGEIVLERDTGYRGLWYFNQRVESKYRWVYSGGLGTYCAKHIPMAVYAPEVEKTFFVYGGTKRGEHALLEMVSYYDHRRGTVPRPMILMDKQTNDGHDNPVIALDRQGHVWVFASAHGIGRPGFIFRSTAPYSIDAWEMVCERNFSYPQPWWLDGLGFVMLETNYGPEGRRLLYVRRSKDGRNWEERRGLAAVERGHYQVSGAWGGNVATAFNYHCNAWKSDPKRSGCSYRTNLYYMETDDGGLTWHNAAGALLDLPVTEAANDALVKDYEEEGLLVYLKDINFDAAGRPLVLHLVVDSWVPGPTSRPRAWRIAQWDGEHWRFHTITRSDNNYDTGSLYVDPDGAWRVIGPTEPGPQRGNTGGEVAVWLSVDEGRTWEKVRNVTRESPLNHSYIRRPVNAHPEFHAFWADGHGREPSESRLYFCNRAGTAVFRLPYEMTGEETAPERVFAE